MGRLNVNWDYVKVTPMTAEEFAKKLKYWKSIGMTEIKPDNGLTVSTYEKGFKHWFFYMDYCCVFEPLENLKIRIVNEEEDKEYQPYDCFSAVQKKSKELNNCGFGWQYGVVGKEFFELRKCVPRQISWYTKKQNYRFKKLKNCYKADVSSAFSYEATKKLPTWIGHKTVEGVVEPTAEYPFAFVSTGRLIIYGELDTDDFWRTPFYYDKDDRIKFLQEEKDKAKRFRYKKCELSKELGRETDAQVYTVLCRASKYTLKSTFEYFYFLKDNGDKRAKAIMNYFIGMCWQKRSPIYLHLAAVIIARCNKRMIDTATTLAKRGNVPLLIATDSVAWCGKPEEDLVDKKKFLGAFVSELYDGEMFVVRSKKYQMRKGNKLKTVYAGCTDRELYEFGELDDTEYEWMYHDGDVYRFTVDYNGCIVKEEII